MAGDLDEPSAPQGPRLLPWVCGVAFLVAALTTAAVLHRETAAYVAHERPLIHVTRMVRLQHPLPAKYDYSREADMIKYKTNGRDPEAHSQGRLEFDRYKLHIFIKDGKVHCLYDLKASAIEVAQVERLLTIEFAKLVKVSPEDLRQEVVQEIRTDNPHPIKRWPW